MSQTLTNGPRTYKLTLEHKDAVPGCTISPEVITARSITAAIALLYEQHPEYSSVYRVVKVEEEVPEIKFENPVRYEFKLGVSIPHIPDTVTINGAKIIGPALVDILNIVTQPNSHRWYRFERQGDLITVHTKEDEPRYYTPETIATLRAQFPREECPLTNETLDKEEAKTRTALEAYK